MKDWILKTLKLAFEESVPAIIIYNGKERITQRRIYIRKIIDDKKIIAFCASSKGIRTFEIDNILSVVMQEL